MWDIWTKVDDKEVLLKEDLTEEEMFYELKEYIKEGYTGLSIYSYYNETEPLEKEK